MSLGLAHITFDCAEPARLAAFWSAALDQPVDEGAGEFFASLGDHVPDRPSWFFIRVPESKVGKNRIHVDLTAADREVEVARLIGLVPPPVRTTTSGEQCGRRCAIPRATSSASARHGKDKDCLLYTSPSPRDRTRSRMPSSA